MGKEEKKQRVAGWNQVVIPDRVKLRAYERWEADGDCWISTYSTGSHGYAQIGWQNPDERHVVLAHRAAWENVNGQVPRGMTIDHLCKQRQCVNPEHLRVLPNYENARRTDGRDWPLGQCVNGHSNEHLADHGGRTHCTICVTTIWGKGEPWQRVGSPNVHHKVSRPPKKPRQARKGSTHCIHGHERSPENIYERADGKQQCRQCRTEGARKERERKTMTRGAAIEVARKSIDSLNTTSLSAEQQKTVAELMNALQDLEALQMGRRAA